ncbi:unnamed protein product [Brassicogethes aeneus]|uniref:Mitochondrial ornithine transporter 1 n=1 Tax=Brassicogethes aeneus TaxID=1431903 RepID=A0A9P0FKP4_BRAAE|nr:unnamed protein product [Brassicogethes aeneus]
MEMTEMPERPQHFKDGLIDFTAGSLAGAACVYVGQPLDTVKVKMQTFPDLYKNMISCFTQTLKTDGVYKGLYAGTVPALATNIAENSVLFLCYGFCQKIMQNLTGTAKIEDLSTVSNATAGFLASFFSSIAICPTELVKCKLQAMREISKQDKLAGVDTKMMGPLHLTSYILKTDGPQGLFKGLVPTLVREMPGYFFFFGGYEGTRELLRQPGKSKDEIGLLRTMIAGSVGGIVFWSLTYPIDMAKSRIQVGKSQENLVGTIMSILRNEGVVSLYHGLTPSLLRTIPATAALFATYEYSKKWLNGLSKDL